MKIVIKKAGRRGVVPGRAKITGAVAVAVAALTAALVGCASLTEILDGLNSGGGIAAFGGGDSPRASSSRYVLPASYDAAYAYRTGAAYQNMRNIPKNIDANRAANPAEYVRQAAAYINESSKDDFERVKKAHDLVALLVKYDAKNFWAGTVPDQSYASVLKNKLAVCEGYSNLFKKLCDELAVPCDIVHGFGRGVGTSPFAGDTPTDSNHAWNIVAINGENYLIDCTWDSGYMDGRTAKQEYTTDWLFLKPEHFLHSHFPEKPEQQLMETPLSAGEFLKLPFFKPKFFEIVEEYSPALVNINQVTGADDGKFTLKYAVKEGFEVDFKLYDETGGKAFPNNSISQQADSQQADSQQADGQQADGQQAGGNGAAYVAFPAAGNYLLRVFWKKAGAKTSVSCGELGFTAASGSAVTYPTLLLSSGKNTMIVSPLEMPLRAGTTYGFRVRVDNKKVVTIICGKTSVQLTQGDGNEFTGDVEIPAGVRELSVGIADSAQGRYEIIAQYQVK